MDQVGTLSVFVRVVELGSFSAAARASELTPSAVSKQISALEDRLGVRLINRTTRRLNLTEEGRALYDRASRILAELQEAEQAVSDLRATPKGNLRLNLPSAFAAHHVAPLVPEYLARYPEMRIDMVLNDRFVDMVEEGFDLTIRIGDLADSSLIARRLMRNRRVICATASYLERHSPLSGPEDLAAHNCLVYSYRASRNDWPIVGPNGQTEVVQVSGNLESNNPETLRQAAMQGLGIVLMPLWLVGRDLTEGKLVDVLPGHHAPDSAVYAIYPPGRHLSPRVRSFVDFLVERFNSGDTYGMTQSSAELSG